MPPEAKYTARGWRRSSPSTATESARDLSPTLHNMETEGLLRSTQQVVAGRARRTYVATAKGRKSLDSTKRQLRELADEVLGDERG
jgi:DNA-binding PadR family transcriptional regulator